MKFLNVVTGIFCLYNCITKFTAAFFYESYILGILKGIPESNIVSQSIYSSSEFIFIIIWGITFLMLFLFWLWANVKGKTSVKILLSALVISFSLLMSITDNIGYSFYINDTIIDGELIG